MVTVVNGVNNEMVGPIFDYCMKNHTKMGGPAFQPVSFTGRDEDVTDEARLRQRYTTSHLAHDLARYYDGRIDPLRDWYPLGSATAFAALTDHLKGPEAEFGQLSCGCHPNCGAATMLLHNTEDRRLGADHVVLRPRPLLPRPRRRRRLGARPRAHAHPARPLVPAQLRREEGARGT